jgi:hypothetical protein
VRLDVEEPGIRADADALCSAMEDSGGPGAVDLVTDVRQHSDGGFVRAFDSLDAWMLLTYGSVGIRNLRRAIEAV